jgi:hypothetical protein
VAAFWRAAAEGRLREPLGSWGAEPPVPAPSWPTTGSAFAELRTARQAADPGAVTASAWQSATPAVHGGGAGFHLGEASPAFGGAQPADRVVPCPPVSEWSQALWAAFAAGGLSLWTERQLLRSEQPHYRREELRRPEAKHRS